MGKVITILILVTGFTLSAYSAYEVEGRPTLSFVKFQKLIARGRAETVDDTLVLLHKHYPSFFQNYILMRRSRSLQPSSDLYPRALLVGPGAKMVIAFSGDPKGRGSSNLEVMEFSDAENRFEFREIRFVKSGPPRSSPVNPSKCLGCHQGQDRVDTDPRPNWEPYSLWPGAFGSNGGTVSSGFVYDNRIRPEDQRFVEEHLNEKEVQKYFSKYIKPFHSRYRLLGPFNPGFTVDFTDTLLQLNYRRVIRLAQATPFYKAYKYAFVAAARCRHLPWPKATEDWHLGNDFYPEKIRASSAPPTFFGGYPDGDTGREYTPPPPPKFPKRQLSASIALIFEPLGINTEDWSTDFRTEGGRFAFRERFGLPSSPTAKMRSALKVMEPVLSKLSCEELEVKSFQALHQFMEVDNGLAQAEVQLKQTLEQKNRPAIQVCAKCHQDPEDVYVPEIPFENPKKLSQLIQSGTFEKGSFVDEVIYRTGAHAKEGEQMPPRGPLSEKQRGDLIEYIRSL